MEFGGTLVEFGETLVEFGATMVEFGGTLVEFRGSLVEFGGTLVEFVISCIIIGGFTKINGSTGCIGFGGNICFVFSFRIALRFRPRDFFCFLPSFL